MKLKKIVGLLLVLGLMAAMIMGCAASEPNEQQSEQNSPQQQTEKTDQPDTIKETATYTGRIDNNSVEMDVQGTPQAFQLTEELMETWDSLGFVEGDQLELQYQERENDRPILLKAEEV